MISFRPSAVLTPFCMFVCFFSFFLSFLFGNHHAMRIHKNCAFSRTHAVTHPTKVARKDLTITRDVIP